MKRLLLSFAIAALGALAVVGGYRAELARPIPAAANRLDSRLVVARGSTFRAVAEELARRGWVRNAWLLRLEARRLGTDRRVIPGRYVRKPGESAASLLRRLAAGDIEDTRVTLPEGWRLTRMLTVLADSCEVPRAELDARARAPEWVASGRVPGPTIEGYLLPDTYRFAKGETPDRVLEVLLAAGETFYRDSLAADAEAAGLSRRELWSLASVIEAEAARAEERAKISAVFWNRLRRGQRLESDPTVLFALDRAPGRVLYRDLEIDSPYNTYRYAGLPPGPICAPGRASLRAALHPTPGFTALFFVARGDGSHVFSSTLAEHNRARREIAAARL